MQMEREWFLEVSKKLKNVARKEKKQWSCFCKSQMEKGAGHAKALDKLKK